MSEKQTTEPSGADPVKQVIIIRKDLKMRRGKEIAQGSHASMKFLCKRLQEHQAVKVADLAHHGVSCLPLSIFSKEEFIWITGSFAKICLRVESEEELLAVYDQAQKAGLITELVTDKGLTEFNGVPTNTAVAIGPDRASKIDKITGELKLY